MSIGDGTVGGAVYCLVPSSRRFLGLSYVRSMNRNKLIKAPYLIHNYKLDADTRVMCVSGAKTVAFQPNSPACDASKQLVHVRTCRFTSGTFTDFWKPPY